MTILTTAPTSAEVLARLNPDDGEDTVLAQVERGPFTVRVTRWDAKDGVEECSEPPQIVLDCRDQDGGEMFFDLTVLPHNVDDFTAVALESAADYKALTGGIEIEKQDGAFDGEWHRSAGTVGTPSLRVGPLEREVYASTFWQENEAGDKTELFVMADLDRCQIFHPREALDFAIHLAQEASRAMAIESREGRTS